MFTEKLSSVINVSLAGQWGEGGWVKSSALKIFARQQSLAELLDGEHYGSVHLTGVDLAFNFRLANGAGSQSCY